ncbi:MAG: hypothetical protein FWG72_08200 [Oscillospiraceae bacterium]|nr:hypothetical protein [Oscillospiraceae bacterium]
MADTKTFPIGPNFNMNEMVAKLTQLYQSKGFQVSQIQIGTSVTLTFDKDTDGIKKFVGLGLGIKANISINNNALIVNFSDAEWTGKIIGLAVGWVLCLIPFLLACYGAVQQSDLPKKIGNDIQMLAAS